MIDRLIEKISETDNVSVVGLDTCLKYLPEEARKHVTDFREAADAILEFNCAVIDRIYDFVPAVKVQVAYYEMYGYEGMWAFAETLKYAKRRGMVTIADAKRNDIGSTAEAYAKAYLGKTEIGGRALCAFDADFLTVNGYLGADGILPFAKECAENDKGIFVLAKTSNPSGGQLQDRILENGRTVYEEAASLTAEWGKDLIGKYGYSAVGAVVGATYPVQAEKLRKEFPHLFFLVPGYGAQGATAQDVKANFDEKGLGAVVNSSRGILCAYQKEQWRGLRYDEAARRAAEWMQADLNAVRK